ncbi:DUF4136 domain-containing protein [Flavobacteriaceae bacterium S0825]|uniref:DUF4136 domain-containing protein n=1 Tax=Gaetbulibacter sp. S0825 TaxID=2720084 RepID=UPI00142F7EE1|nr:DUF4136 domain-containing protein [Gaetbulibacter sp. S0825]MCK0109903.1 DUF4136 domain-containing protein [Flavobacteriaceae bacterium S0825]NIX65532.1 DUF4136 domain-containing protein [Gaetbulibacter sp. S0825]
MKTLKTLSIIFLLTLYGCASTEAVLAEFDESVDFDSYNTFVLCIDDLFVENTNFPNHDNNKVRELIGNAVENEMINRGHKTNVMDPQLQAGFKLLVEEKEATFYDCKEQDEYSYWAECTINTTIYTEETLVVYVSDFEKNQIIWQASMTCDMSRYNKKLPGYINELVETLFNEYPKIGGAL